MENDNNQKENLKELKLLKKILKIEKSINEAMTNQEEKQYVKREIERNEKQER